MKKQTAVEWLIEQIPLGIRMNLAENGIDFNQAKAMEREQIQDAFYCGIEVDESKVHSPYKAAEDYFKQTYE